MKKILMFFVSLTMCLGFIVYEENTVQAIDDGYKYHSDFPVYLTFSNDTTYRNNLLLKGECVYITSGNISGSYYPIDIITDTLNPGTYVITCDMIGFESDEFLYENGGNIYDAQNDIILPTTWTVNDRTYSAEFTVTKSTNRLTLGENSTYIQVTEPVYYNRLVMTVSLKKYVNKIPLEFSFQTETYPSPLIFNGDKIMLPANQSYESSNPIDLNTISLSPGNYRLTVVLNGLPSDVFAYPMCGNIYDQKNHISLPTEWSGKERMSIAEFTITAATNKLTLGEQGTYISAMETSPIKRDIMTVSLEKIE